MEFTDIVKKRFSVRVFSDKEVKDEDISRAIDLARLAPSAKNHQPYKVVCVKNEELISAFRDANIPVFNAKAILVFLGSYEKAWKNKRDNAKGSQEMDLSIFLTYVNLALEDMTISSCIVGAFDKVDVANILNIHDDFVPYAIMPIGYASMNAEPFYEMHDKRKGVDQLLAFLA